MRFATFCGPGGAIPLAPLRRLQTSSQTCSRWQPSKNNTIRSAKYPPTPTQSIEFCPRYDHQNPGLGCASLDKHLQQGREAPPHPSAAWVQAVHARGGNESRILARNLGKGYSIEFDFGRGEETMYIPIFEVMVNHVLQVLHQMKREVSHQARARVILSWICRRIDSNYDS